MTTGESPRGKPTWQVHARPIGASREPWSLMTVEARSVIQAEAILRRHGYEMATQAAMRAGPGDERVLPGEIRPLSCTSCGYGLTGLTIEHASVICPECSYPQPLIAWNHEQARTLYHTPWVIYLFAMLGMFGTGLILLLILLSLVM